MRVLIAGAGIGGLTAALALRQVGFDVRPACPASKNAQAAARLIGHRSSVVCGAAAHRGFNANAIRPLAGVVSVPGAAPPPWLAIMATY